MRPRTRPSVQVPLFVAATVIALALGSLGTAVAAPALTVGKVKSIAAKVVKKAAPKLSVAHATTADNATALAGQPATAYLSPYYRVGYSVAGGSATKTLPTVPNGTYLVTVNVSAQLASGAAFGCSLRTPSPGSTILMPTLAAVSDIYAEIDSSRIVTVTGPMTFFCATDPSTTFTSPTAGLPANQITFLRIDGGTFLGDAS